MECKSNLKNFLESVYSNLKNPTLAGYKFPFKDFPGDIEGNMLWENFPRFGNPGKTCNSKIKLGP